MEMNTRQYGDRRLFVDLPTAGLLAIVVLSFSLHLFSRAFSGYAYAVLLVACTLLYMFSRKVFIRKASRFILIWLVAVVVLAGSFLNSQRSNGAFLDLIVFSCGFFLLLFCSEDENMYLRCAKAIKYLAVFFAVGVWLQRFLPAIYKAVIIVFPPAYRSALLSKSGSGFTLNTGFSAGYIIAGLLVVFSELKGTKKITVKHLILPLFLLITLLLTGKRGPAVFLILTVAYCFLAPFRGSKKIIRYLRILLIVLFAAVVVWVFRDVLSSIPIVNRVIKTITGVVSGQDVTSGRSRLYAWALELFRQNPLFGIGWGRFRTTTVGNVTLVKSLETHNIYLQLLAETGLIGFVSFLTLFFIFWNTARKAYCQIVRNGSDSSAKWRALLLFSLAYQTYFLLYGLTGNPLYDPHFQIMYIFSCLITTAYSSAYRAS